MVKSEETKVRQEDLSKLLYEVQLLRTQQDNMECQVQDMKQWVRRMWRLNMSVLWEYVLVMEIIFVFSVYKSFNRNGVNNSSK